MRRSFLFALLLICGSLQACSYYVPATLDAMRAKDTLSVAIQAPRWDPVRDSLIVECAGCATDKARIVEHFPEQNEASFQIEPTQQLTLKLYSMGRLDTELVLAGSGSVDTAAPEATLRRMATSRHSRYSSSSEEAATTKTKTERAPKKATQLKVIAPEGVAIYTDKTKRQVIKILPQGTVMTLLSREGDLYSVSVDGGEGFVEAEAVQIIE